MCIEARNCSDLWPCGCFREGCIDFVTFHLFVQVLHKWHLWRRWVHKLWRSYGHFQWLWHTASLSIVTLTFVLQLLLPTAVDSRRLTFLGTAIWLAVGPCVVRPSVKTYSAWCTQRRDLSETWHTSGCCWKGFQGQRSRSRYSEIEKMSHQCACDVIPVY